MDVFTKYIIEKDSELGLCLVIGNVTFHKELVIDKANVRGGGNFRINGKTLLLHGSSFEFGRPIIKDIKEAINERNVYSNKYKTHGILERFDEVKVDWQSEIVTVWKKT